MSVPSPALPRTLQELPSAGARLCLDVRRFLLTQLRQERGEAIGETIVGFSGGADSTALALVLRCLGVPVCLAHLDHGLRSESAAEARAATVFAARLGVACHVRRVEVAKLAQAGGMGLEEAGRQARYAFLEEVRQKRNAPWIATGHHLDDLSEDVLLRLTRGTGWPGLGGMEALDSGRHLVRPL
ncbi:MAG: tRNA lysidine(34) synthetase TilS, partial [Bilophila sp.]